MTYAPRMTVELNLTSKLNYKIKFQNLQLTPNQIYVTFTTFARVRKYQTTVDT